MKRMLIGLSAIGCALAAAACGSDRSPSTAPSALAAATAARTAGTTTATRSLIGVWGSSHARASTLSASSVSAASTGISLEQCQNLQMAITSQTTTQASGTLSMQCPDDITLSGPVLLQLGAPVIPITWNGLASRSGSPSCPFSMVGTGTPLTAETFQMTYTGDTCLGAVHGSDTLRLGVSTPNTPTAPAVARDHFDMSQVTMRSSPQSFANWPITTAITAVELRPSGVHLDFSKQNGPGRWPDITPPGWSGPLQWTLGMVLNVGGRLYGAAPIQFWYGLQESGGPPQDYAINWFYDPGRWAPMTGHQPAVGEQIGIFACAGDCRNNNEGSLSPVKERSNVVVVTMPGPGGGRFTF